MYPAAFSMRSKWLEKLVRVDFSAPSASSLTLTLKSRPAHGCYGDVMWEILIVALPLRRSLTLPVILSLYAVAGRASSRFAPGVVLIDQLFLPNSSLRANSSNSNSLSLRI